MISDFGKKPVLLGNVTANPTAIGVGGILGGLVAMAATGPVGAGLAAYATINDWLATREPEPDNYLPEPVKREVIKPVQPEPKPSTPKLVDTLTQNPYQCRAIIAGQRTGKTYSAAMATRLLANTGTKVFYINLFDHGQGNSEAFAHAECVTGDLTACEDSALIMQAEILVKRFYREDDAILVVDEFTNLGASTQSDVTKALMEEISRKANSLASRGMASGKAIWAVAPFVKASVLTAEAKTTIKQFKPLVLSIPAGRSVDWVNPRTGKAVKITADEQVINDVAANFSRSITMPPVMNCDRCYWWNGEWHPVGRV